MDACIDIVEIKVCAYSLMEFFCGVIIILHIIHP